MIQADGPADMRRDETMIACDDFERDAHPPEFGDRVVDVSPQRVAAELGRVAFGSDAV